MSQNNVSLKNEQIKRMVLIGSFLLQAYVMATDLGSKLAIPSILKSFGAQESYGLLITSYGLVMAIAAPVGGKFGDTFGRKTAMILGTSIFAVGNILCFIAPSFPLYFIGFMTLGLGMGLMFSLPVTMIGDITTEKEFPKFMGFYTSVNNIAMLLGPLLGGFITDIIGARLVHIYLLPIGITALWIIHRNYQEKSKAGEKPIIAYLGIVFLALGVGPILLLFNLGGTSFDWLSLYSFALLATGIIFVFIFIRHQLKFKEPIIAVELFKIPSIARGYLRALLIRPYLAIITTYLILFGQNGLGASATTTGSFALPRTIATIILPAIIGAWIAKKGAKRLNSSLIIGGTIIVIGCLVMAFSASTSIAIILIYVTMLLLGIGHSFYYVSNLPNIKSELPEEKMGSGIAIYTFISIFSSAFYAAIFSGVLNAFNNDITKAFPVMCYIAAFGALLFILLSIVDVKTVDEKESAQETTA